MGLRTLRWRVAVLVGGAMVLSLVTMAATILSTRPASSGWAHLVAMPSAGLALVVSAATILALGRWIDSARVRLLREHRSAERLVRYREADRIANDLGSTTARDLIGISLALQSAAARHPSAAPALRAVTADMDRVLRELRSHVFNPEPTIADVLAALDPELPGSPTVHGCVDVPAPATLESLLRELLPLFPAAVRLSVSTADGGLRVAVTGPTPADQITVRETAADHDATTSFEPDHVTIEWVVPL